MLSERLTSTSMVKPTRRNLVAQSSVSESRTTVSCRGAGVGTCHVHGGKGAVVTVLTFSRTLCRSCCAPAAHSSFCLFERTSPSSAVGRSLGTTSSSAGARPAGYCSVCDCGRVRVPARTALAVAARPPRGRQDERRASPPRESPSITRRRPAQRGGQDSPVRVGKSSDRPTSAADSCMANCRRRPISPRRRRCNT